MRRWVVLLLGVVGCSEETSGSPPDNEPGVEPVDPAAYLDRPLREQIEAAQSGALSCAGLSAGYLARVEERDRGAAGIHSVLLVDPAAGDTAAGLDAALDPDAPARLQCAVVLIKDNIDTAGLATTAGSIALANNVPAEDAFVVKRLREDNALSLGKANLSEWANFRGYGSTSGWSSLGGQTHNGVDVGYNPCGSSSGSAAAVAGGIVAAALGTETDGSIVCPAAVNGVVGFKPTVGLVSRAGVIPISHTQDTVGPITTTVGDAARLMSVLAGEDPQDPATASIPAGFDFDFESALENATLAGARLGVVDSLTGYDAALDQVFAEQVSRIEAAGATIVHVTLPSAAQIGNDEYIVLLTEFKVGLNAYLASHATAGQPATLAELIAFNDDNASTVMAHFGQEIFELAEATAGLDDAVYLDAKAQALLAAGEQGIAAVMAAEALDALLAPTTGPAWVTNYTTGDDFSGITSTHAAVAGYPHLTVPMGAVNGLPVGLSIFAGAWQDAAVLALGHAYETLP